MRTIKLELTVEVPSNYKIDEGMTDFAQVCDLLDEMEDRYSNVGLIEGRIIGEQNDGKEEEHRKPINEEKYDGNMDKECIKLCDILNSVPSIDTFESCCGHLKDRYSIWFFCNDSITISRLGRCVERNYSDGKWELLVDSTDTHPTGVFWLRSKVPFHSYDEMEKSVNELCNNIQHWFNTKFDSYFNGNSCK